MPAPSGQDQNGAAGHAAGPSVQVPEEAAAALSLQEDEEERLEREALGKVVLAFRRYSVHANAEVDRWEHNYRSLPHHQQLLLAHLRVKFSTARQCIHNNQFFINSMLSAFDPDGDEEGGPGNTPPAMLAGANAAADAVAQLQPHAVAGDTDKVRYVLKNLVRDWSEEGVAEREASYGRILTELRRVFRDWDPDAPQRPRVLVPGAGLARLCCEIAGAGMEVQGNEFAYFMLITSSFILNSISEPAQYTVFPWVTSACNNVRDSDQLRGVTIPDVRPVDIVARSPHNGLLSMAAGDFVEVYSAASQEGAWDCVVTCFFIDTAHNVVQYLEIVSHCLKPGGYWINLGPLLYHWADGFGWSELSVELSLEDVKRVAQAMGFTMLQDQTVDAPYIANVKSMYQTVYKASFFTMQKTGHPMLHAPYSPAPPHPPPPDSTMAQQPTGAGGAQPERNTNVAAPQ